MTDDLTSALRTQMRAATAADALPPGYLDRVHAGVRRRARRTAVAASAAGVAGVAAVALLAAPGGASAPREVATMPATAPSSAVAAPALGPDDAQVQAAGWWSYVSQVRQGSEVRREQRWVSRAGELVVRDAGGGLERLADDVRHPIGARGLTWDELERLPRDVDEVVTLMAGAPGHPADAESVVDQARQVLGRSPTLRPGREVLVEAVRRAEGTTETRDARDALGRPALLLRAPDRDGGVVELYVDPGGLRLLEERYVAGPGYPVPPSGGPVAPGGPTYAPGQVLFSETYVAWGTEAPPGR